MEVNEYKKLTGIVYYLLSNPSKIEELEFNDEYINVSNSTESNAARNIFSELKEECIKYNLIIPYDAMTNIMKSLHSESPEMLESVLVNFFAEGKDFVQDKTSSDMDYYVKKLANDSINKLKNGIIAEASDAIKNDDKLSFDDACKKFESHLQKKGGKYFVNNKDMRIFDDLFDPELQKARQTETIPCKFEMFNKYLGGFGFQKQTITAVQASTGKGKTTMLVSLATDILQNGFNVAYINMEVREDEFTHYILAGLQDEYSYDDISHNFNESNPEFVNNLRNLINSKNLGKFILLKNTSFNGLNAKQIEEQLLLKEEELDIKFDIVFIDYLALLHPYMLEQGTDRSDLIDQRVARECKLMGDRNNWAIVTATQENRGALQAKDKEKNGMAYISNSFAVIFELDNYITFERKEDVNAIKIEFHKNRQYHKGDIMPFMLKYDEKHKKYVEDKTISIEPDDLKWKQVVDLVHDKMCRKDIVTLLENNDMPASKSNLSTYCSKRHYDTPKTTVKGYEPENVDIAVLLNAKFNQTFGNNTMVDLSIEKLFG